MTKNSVKTPVKADKPKIRKPARKRTPKLSGSAAKPAAVAVKEKHVRGRFSFPVGDYELIAELKSVAKKNGRAAKKNELLTAGLRALRAMHDDALIAALAACKPSKAAPPAKADDD